MIEATDIENARNLNTIEVMEAGGTEAWFTSQGFSAEDVESVVGDVAASLVSLAISSGAEAIPDLFHSAFAAGLAIGWMLHRDRRDG